jgi:hypothetical protein
MGVSVQQRVALDDEHPGRIARRSWPQGNPLGRKIEIEKVDAHGEMPISGSGRIE